MSRKPDLLDAFAHDDSPEAIDVAVLGLSTPAVAPPASLRLQIVGEASTTRNAIETTRRDDGWVAHEVAGVRVKKLAQRRETVELLLEMAPGSDFPHHQHIGDEGCLVVRGSFSSPDGRWSAGDYLFASEGSAHGPFRSEQGCLLFLVVDARDYESSQRASG